MPAHARRTLRRLALALAATAALAVAAPPSGHAADAPVNLRISSFNPGSSWYVYGVTLGELLRKHLPAGSNIDAPPGGGGTANPLLVSAGKADIGLGFSVANVWARQGEAFFKKPVDNLRGLMGGLDQYYLGILANEAKGPDTLEDYLKKNGSPRVMLLTKGSFGAYSGDQLLEMLGASEKEVTGRGGSYTLTTFDNVKTAFASGRSDLFIQVTTAGQPAFTEMAETGTITFLDLSDETLAGMRTRFGWNVATLPANTFRGQDRPLKLPGTTTSLIVAADMPDDLAYTIVSTVCENEAEFKAAHEALKGFDCATKAWNEEDIGLPLHPGAARYYREKGWLK